MNHNKLFMLCVILIFSAAVVISFPVQTHCSKLTVGRAHNTLGCLGGRPVEVEEEYFFVDDTVKKTSKKRHATVERRGVWKIALSRFNRLKIQGPMYVHWSLNKNNSLSVLN
jgi:hypothetical protein